MPNAPSFVSLNVTALSAAVQVVIRSIARRPAAPEKMNRVSSRSRVEPGTTQSALTVSSPWLFPVMMRAIALWTIVPAFGRSAAGVSNE